MYGIPLICHVFPSNCHESLATNHLLSQPVMYPKHPAADLFPNSLSCILTICHVSHQHVMFPQRSGMYIQQPVMYSQHPFMSPAPCNVAPSTCHVSPQPGMHPQQPVMYPIDLSCISINFASILGDQSLISATCHVSQASCRGQYPRACHVSSQPVMFSINMSCFPSDLSCAASNLSCIASALSCCLVSPSTCHVSPAYQHNLACILSNLSCIPLICHVSPPTIYHVYSNHVYSNLSCIQYPINLSCFPTNLPCVITNTTWHASSTTCHVPVSH